MAYDELLAARIRELIGDEPLLTLHGTLDALLPIRERTLGPEHPDTLTTRLNLARWRGEAGGPAGASDAEHGRHAHHRTDLLTERGRGG